MVFDIKMLIFVSVAIAVYFCLWFLTGFVLAKSYMITEAVIAFVISVALGIVSILHFIEVYRRYAIH